MATAKAPSEKSFMNPDWMCGICKTDEDKQIIQCNKCEDWYHMECARVSKDAVENIDWYCPKCTEDQENLIPDTSDINTVIRQPTSSNELIRTQVKSSLNKMSIKKAPSEK